MELADLLSERDIQELARPTGEASGLPGHAYGADFFGLETRRLFPRTWCAVAYESDVPTMGDALPVDVAGWPLVLIRGADQQVRVFHNVCRHRQMQVVPEPCKAPHLSAARGTAGPMLWTASSSPLLASAGATSTGTPSSTTQISIWKSYEATPGWTWSS